MTKGIHDRGTFGALRRSRRRVRRSPLTVTWVPGSPTEPTRVAYAIGRTMGNAVVRNRLRRRLRAIIKELEPSLPSGAYLVGAAPEAAGLSFGELRSKVSEVLLSVTKSELG